MNEISAIVLRDKITSDTPPPAAATTGGFFPFIAAVVPTLNEDGYIEACLMSLLGQWPQESLEVLVMDGGSTDGTQDRVAALALRYPNLRLLRNPRRLQSAAMNLAARLASPKATILLRADAHAVYPAGFVRHCVNDLLRTGAVSVVVPMRTQAEQGHVVQRAIAVAQSSRLGNGGSAHRIGGRSSFVEHGHHAAFDRAFFLSIGGYDESFTHNEDAEFDHRVGLAGGRVWMCAQAPVSYFPRKTLEALARQYFRHGKGRARTLVKHQLRPRPRQVVPVIATCALLGGMVLAPVEPLMGLAALAYPAACLAWGVARATVSRDAGLLAAGPALLAMHIFWACGFLKVVSRQLLPKAFRSMIPAASANV